MKRTLAALLLLASLAVSGCVGTAGFTYNRAEGLSLDARVIAEQRDAVNIWRGYLTSNPHELDRHGANVAAWADALDRTGAR